MKHRAALKGFLSRVSWPFCHGRQDIFQGVFCHGRLFAMAPISIVMPFAMAPIAFLLAETCDMEK